MTDLYTLVIFHPMDPRGAKVGGVETHLRVLMERHPADFRILLVGVDEIGDLPLGVVSPLAFRGRRIHFLPVAHIDARRINEAADRLWRSTTLRFALGAARRLPAIRRALGPRRRASAEFERFEFALLPRRLGIRSAMIIHNEGAREQAMDSLLKKMWWLHRLNERIAVRSADHIFCVNASIRARAERLSPAGAGKTEIMSVAVDRRRFATRPFDLGDDVFRVVYAGRLDGQKNPTVMFRIAADVANRIPRFEFHYVGASDPARYPESAALGGRLIRHGNRSADEVATILARCHAGILTSYFEGLPCFLLEGLSVGRPFAALRLPQYDPLILPGVSGFQVEPNPPDQGAETRMAESLVALWEAIRSRTIDPQTVGAVTEPYSTDRQLERLFERHRRFQDEPRARLRAHAPAAA